MTTEDKIKEAFEDWFENSGSTRPFFAAAAYRREFIDAYQAGYMACLNGLEVNGAAPNNAGQWFATYRLPEGVTK